MTIVQVKYVTAIPSEAVTYSILGYGGTFNGGEKSTLDVSIDLSISGSMSLTTIERSWGESREYRDEDALPVSGKPDWFRALRTGAPVVDRGTLTVDDSNVRASWDLLPGASHGVRLFVAGKNPLLTLAPAIDGEIVVAFKLSGEHLYYKIKGDHDGFPNHIISINGNQVYAHDCVGGGKTPANLAPPSEVNAAIDNWTQI